MAGEDTCQEEGNEDNYNTEEWQVRTPARNGRFETSAHNDVMKMIITFFLAGVPTRHFQN